MGIASSKVCCAHSSGSSEGGAPIEMISRDMLSSACSSESSWDSSFLLSILSSASIVPIFESIRPHACLIQSRFDMTQGSLSRFLLRMAFWRLSGGSVSQPFFFFLAFLALAFFLSSISKPTSAPSVCPPDDSVSSIHLVASNSCSSVNLEPSVSDWM